MAKFLIMNDFSETHQADHLTEDDLAAQREEMLWIFDISDPEHPFEICDGERQAIPKWEPC